MISEDDLSEMLSDPWRHNGKSELSCIHMTSGSALTLPLCFYRESSAALLGRSATLAVTKLSLV